MDSYKHRSKSMNGPKVLTRECCEWAREESQVDEGAVQETRKVQKKKRKKYIKPSTKSEKRRREIDDD